LIRSRMNCIYSAIHNYTSIVLFSDFGFGTRKALLETNSS
jgi:hypothetical protein